MPKLNSRPRLREKGSSALLAQQNSLLNKLRLLPAHYPEVQERRAPKLLHVGRRISGDPGSKGWRVAWTTSFGFVRTCHSSKNALATAVPLRRPRRARWTEGAADRCPAIRDRLTGRTPRSDRGDRGSTPCPGAPRGRVAQLRRALVSHARGCWFESSLAHHMWP